MRRWNGWGDDSSVYDLPDSAARYARETLGPGRPPKDVPLDAVLAQVPPSRLPAHPLISADAEARVRHARGQSFPDWVAMRSGQLGAFPDGIAFPQDREQVRELLEFATAHNVALIPYGGGSSVVGHVNPIAGERPTLTVDMTRMNRLLTFDRESQLATFGAGVSGPELEAQLRAHGYTLGHYPQSFEYSTLGGWVVTRSSGQQSLRYGRIEKLFAGGHLETPAGPLELPATFPASAAGPDLRELVLGSEGRLGILTEATVRVTPLPEKETFHAVFFPNFEAGRTAVREIVQAGIPLSMLRLSTAMETETTLAMAGHETLLGALKKYLALRGAGDERCMLIVGVTGSETLTDAASKATFDITGKHSGVYATQTFGKTWHKNRFRSPYLRNALWEVGYGIDTLETATSWSNVPTMVKAIEEALHPGLLCKDEFVHVFTHLSHVYPYGSSIYVQFLFRLAPTPEETLECWRTLKASASEAIVANGGTISHQHGVGADHAPYLQAEKGALGITAIHAALRVFDPQGLMNPGKLLSQESEVRNS